MPQSIEAIPPYRSTHQLLTLILTVEMEYALVWKLHLVQNPTAC